MNLFFIRTLTNQSSECNFQNCVTTFSLFEKCTTLQCRIRQFKIYGSHICDIFKLVVVSVFQLFR